MRKFVAASLLAFCVGWPALADVPLAEVRARPAAGETIDFLLPDRFKNGDTANDTGGLQGDRYSTGFDPAAKGYYHGGDLKGLLSRLDYLQGLGATAIWVAPVFKNKPVQGLPGQESAGYYYEYWVTDFTRVDPHFGTNAEFKALVGDVRAGAMIDLWHLSHDPTGWEVLAEAPLTAIAYVEIDDALAPLGPDLMAATMDRRTFPGEGILETQRFADLLIARGYQGPVSVEILSRTLITEPVESFASQAFQSSSALFQAA